MSLSSARWSLRLPRQCIQNFATRTTPPPRGPRSRLPKHVPIQRRGPAYPSRQPGKDPDPTPETSNEPPKDAAAEASKVDAVSNALATTPQGENSLLSPVYIPEDPNGVLKETHPVMRLLDNSTLVIQRQLEMMNVLMGFEQANRYVIMDPHGSHIGYLAEQEHGVGNAVARQMFKTHRSFTTHVFDKEEKEVLRFHRPFSWISSRIRVYDAIGKDAPAYTTSNSLQGTSVGSIALQTSANISSIPLQDMRIIGAAEQEWAPLRRKYNMFLARNLDDSPAAPHTPQIASGDLPLSSSKAVAVAEGDTREVGMLQFARVDEPFLSWDFSLKSEDSRLLGSVNRNFAGFAREIFTDTGVYALRMDSAGTEAEQSGPVSGMTLDQRAVMLATAVSIDFDYFSRHSGSGIGGMWPLWMPWWGGGEAAGGVAAGEAGAVGAAGESGIASEAGAAAREMGQGGAMAGAGTLAGYEAMQRGREATQQAPNDDQSPQAGNSDPYLNNPGQQSGLPGDEGLWGQTKDPWAQEDSPEQDPWGSQGGGDGSGGGDSDWGDWF
ncbi:Scramblase-domain-containing protein [Ampelomyces quisqualis]|uniref:Scramblase-domain-containing protein n=1 Tax=Ampelomyces quisqualis TaxID=50730 RepID=A0A6A5QUX1_AMPQU|nr:Scramblase-domain-containing protein [Ampelomyces quisqualis]